MGQHIAFPLHEMSRLVIGGRFFERIEGIWLFVWVFGTACHLAALLHAAAVAFAQAFALPSHRTAVPPLVAMALTIAFFPPDETIAWHAAGALPALAIGFGLPLGLAVVAWRGARCGALEPATPLCRVSCHAGVAIRSSWSGRRSIAMISYRVS